MYKEKTDYQKCLESIIKKAIKKHIDLFDTKGDVYFKLSYVNNDSEEFKSSLNLGIETAIGVEIFYNKTYNKFIEQEDMLVDALINMVLGYTKRVDSSFIKK